jgi:hypothetical protein
MVLSHFLANTPGVFSREKEIERKRDVTNEKRTPYNVTPEYGAETICGKRLEPWQVIWQTLYFMVLTHSW